MSTQELSTELLKQLALMQFNGETFTIDGDRALNANGEEIEEYMEDPRGDDKYIVLTDEEADEKAAQYIRESLWAFNASFIIDHSKLPHEAEGMIKSWQAEKCEDANDTIEALIDDMDVFIEDAISADGRGHFITSYDGNENEETVNGERFYIYRMN